MSSEGVDSEEDVPNEANIEELVKELPQASDKINAIVDSVLSSLPKKYGLSTICSFTKWAFLLDGEIMWSEPFSRLWWSVLSVASFTWVR